MRQSVALLVGGNCGNMVPVRSLTTRELTMALEFPTMAERALKEFRDATRTVSLATIAKRHGATRVQHWDHVEYVFEDDTTLTVRGRGRNHQVKTHLP